MHWKRVVTLSSLNFPLLFSSTLFVQIKEFDLLHFLSSPYCCVWNYIIESGGLEGLRVASNYLNCCCRDLVRTSLYDSFKVGCHYSFSSPISRKQFEFSCSSNHFLNQNNQKHDLFSCSQFCLACSSVLFWHFGSLEAQLWSFGLSCLCCKTRNLESSYNFLLVENRVSNIPLKDSHLISDFQKYEGFFQENLRNQSAEKLFRRKKEKIIKALLLKLIAHSTWKDVA